MGLSSLKTNEMQKTLLNLATGRRCCQLALLLNGQKVLVKEEVYDQTNASNAAVKDTLLESARMRVAVAAAIEAADDIPGRAVALARVPVKEGTDLLLLGIAEDRIQEAEALVVDPDQEIDTVAAADGQLVGIQEVLDHHHIRREDGILREDAMNAHDQEAQSTTLHQFHKEVLWEQIAI